MSDRYISTYNKIQDDLQANVLLKAYYALKVRKSAVVADRFL